MRRALEPADFPFLDYRRFTFSLGVETSEGIWLAGNTAARFDAARRGMVVTGDLVAQAEVAYDKLRASLAAADLGLDRLARVVEYVVPRALTEYARLGGLRQALFGAAVPATTTVVVNRLLRPEALIEVEAVASRQPSMAVSDGLEASRPSGSGARRAGSTLYIPGVSAVDPETSAIAKPGDVVGQAEAIYRWAEATLRAAGLGFEHVVRTAEWLTPPALPAYRDTAEVRRRYFAAPYPAAIGIIMPRLPHPEALLQIEFVAVAGERRRALDPAPGAHLLTYEEAVEAGKVVFLSGHLAVDSRTRGLVHPGDVVGQTRFIYTRLAELLTAAGAGPDAVVKTTEYVTPEGLYAYRDTAAVRREVFRPPYPAATGVVCERLLRDGAVIEVEAVAVTG